MAMPEAGKRRMTDYFAPASTKSEDRESETEGLATTQSMEQDAKPVNPGAEGQGHEKAGDNAEVQKAKRQRRSGGKKAEAESAETPEQSNNNDDDKSQQADVENPQKATKTKADTAEDVKENDEPKAKKPKAKAKPKSVGRPINMDGFVQVAELVDPPVKLVLGPVDGNDTLCMISDSAP